MTYDIEDVPVDFPYKPYNAQINFMQKVIESCKTRQFALLESPTGTGKTLSLLCAIFSYREKIGSQARVVYASRTHSQLSNVIKELKKTRFRPTVTHIASRKQLCLESRVKDKPPGIQARLCHDLRKKKQCIYSHEDRVTSSSPKLLNECRDLKEFIDEAKKLNVCPYLCSQINSNKADLILSPYNYIVDPSVRQHLPLEMFMGSIIVFDEAHNFPDQCSEFLSTDLQFHQIDLAAKALHRLQISTIDLGMSGRKSIDTTTLATVAPLIMRLNIEVQNRKKTDEDIKDLLSFQKNPYKESVFAIKKDSNFLFEILDKSGINESNQASVIALLDNILQVSIGINSRLEPQEVSAIENLQKFFDNIFQPLRDRAFNQQYINDYFSVSVTNQPSISLLCFTPAPGFRQIIDLQPYTIILTSGTLSPLDSFAEELDQQFPIRLENGHVASSDQVFVGIVTAGWNNTTKFEFTHAQRKDRFMKDMLVESMKRVYDIVPKGALTFFPSFSFLEELAPQFQRMVTHKKIWIEPRDNTKTQSVIDGFNKDAEKGATLLGVCRGKLSEGLDFSDDSARCVCIVGIPYPNLADYKIQFKREWFDNKRKGLGSKWYMESAMRAVNQSIGRAIRHINDYAAILLFDDRYPGLQSSLSKWIQPSIRRFQKWEEMITQLKYFYEVKYKGFVYSEIPEKQDVYDGPVFVHSTKPQPRSFSSKKEFKDTTQKDSSSKFKAIEDLSQISSRPLQLKSSKNLSHTKQKPDKEEMKASLTLFFNQGKPENKTKSSSSNSSRNSSSNNSLSIALTSVLNSKKKETVKNHIVNKLSLDSKVINEVIQCVHCQQKAKSALKMVKLDCGHYSCQDCWDFNKVLKIKCPLCHK